MIRKLLASLFVALLFAGVVLADLVEGKVQNVDAAKGTITLTIGGKDQTFKLAKDVKASIALGRTKAKAATLADIKTGAEVILTRNNDDDLITQIQVKAPAKK